VCVLLPWFACTPRATGDGGVATRVAPEPLAVRPLAIPAPAIAHEPEPSSLLVVAGGDVNLGREVGQRIVRSSSYAPFAGIDSVLRDADLRFVNLESQISDQGGETQSPRHRLIFTGPPEAAATLAAARIHVVSTANNHAWDYGRSALLETVERLAAVGVRHVGTGRDIEQAYAPAVLRAKGLSVAFFALTHVWNQGPIHEHEGRHHVAWASFPRLRAALERARAEHDVVLVSYHGGAEYQNAPSDSTRDFAQAVIRAGADAVIGHHPHVIQGVGWVSGRPVFYSLGNLVFDSRSRQPWTRYGMLARLRFGPGSARSFAVCPYRIDDFVPFALDRSASDPERQKFLVHLRRTSTAVGGVKLGASDELGCVEVSPPDLRRVPAGPLPADPRARPLASR
jgi:poly-gamma-glutamate synthesis protein (capsule biosynthesis protein)